MCSCLVIMSIRSSLYFIILEFVSTLAILNVLVCRYISLEQECINPQPAKQITLLPNCSSASIFKVLQCCSNLMKMLSECQHAYITLVVSSGLRVKSVYKATVQALYVESVYTYVEWHHYCSRS